MPQKLANINFHIITALFGLPIFLFNQSYQIRPHFPYGNSLFFLLDFQTKKILFYRYSTCVRRAAGYCCIEYTVCPDAGSSGFSIDTVLATAEVGTSCTLDYIAIEGEITCLIANRFSKFLMHAFLVLL